MIEQTEVHYFKAKAKSILMPLIRIGIKFVTAMCKRRGVEIRHIQNELQSTARRPPSKRFEYQSRFVRFDIAPGSNVLDIGSGNDPFPYATVLADRYLELTPHRDGEIKRDVRPLVICDIQHLPFKDNAFDYVYCSHVLEHVDDPILAVTELERVGPKGYIETPHFMTDALFSWAAERHKWIVQSIDHCLVFFEYDERRAAGVRQSHWLDIIFSQEYHPLQDLFLDNLDIFYCMICWHRGLRVNVYYCDGKLRSNQDN